MHSFEVSRKLRALTGKIVKANKLEEAGNIFYRANVEFDNQALRDMVNECNREVETGIKELYNGIVDGGIN